MAREFGPPKVGRGPPKHGGCIEIALRFQLPLRLRLRLMGRFCILRMTAHRESVPDGLSLSTMA